MPTPGSEIKPIDKSIWHFYQVIYLISFGDIQKILV